MMHGIFLPEVMVKAGGHEALDITGEDGAGSTGAG